MLFPKEKMLGVIFLTAFLSSMVFSMPVSAYELEGGEWSYTRIRDLRYKIDSDDSHYSEICTLSDSAAPSWNNRASQGCPYLHRVTGTDDIFQTYESFDNSILGESYWGPAESTYTWGIVYINTYYYDNSYYENNNHKKSIIAHEYGHILGLMHELDYGALVLMYNSDQNYTDYLIYTPTQDDTNGIDYLYS
jgi:hypothetical protein